MGQLSSITPISSVLQLSHSFKVLISTSKNLMNSFEFVLVVEIWQSASPFEVIDPIMFVDCENPIFLILEDIPVGSHE